MLRYSAKRGIGVSVSHITFTVVFTILLYTVSNFLIMEKFSKWFTFRDSLDYTGLLAFLVVGLCLFVSIFILLAHRWTIKPLAILLTILSATATYFISKYDVQIDRTMVMNAFYTDSSEVGSLLSVQMVPYLLFLVLLPILIILSTRITFRPGGRYLAGSLLVFVVSSGSAVGLVYTEFSSIHRAANVSNKSIINSLVPINYIRSIVSAIHRSAAASLESNNSDVEITGRITSDDNLVVVLAIGETSRQRSFSLYGYQDKNTNPVLSDVSDLHVLNGRARYGTTLLALPEILEKEGIKLPSMTSTLGVETACYVNFTLYDNCEGVGEVPVRDCGHDGKCFDEDVLPLLKDNLQSYSRGYRFIVLHLGGGSHGPSYHDRYPTEFQRFTPMCLDADVLNQCSKEQLINSYDNTILYVDYVLGQTIQQLDSSGVPYVFIYLSDHGESLLEENRIFHGMPPGIPLPPEQAEIPLLIKSSVPISIEPRDEYNQTDVFDTVLDLFSIESKTLNQDRVFITRKQG